METLPSLTSAANKSQWLRPTFIGRKIHWYFSMFTCYDNGTKATEKKYNESDVWVDRIHVCINKSEKETRSTNNLNIHVDVKKS